MGCRFDWFMLSSKWLMYLQNIYIKEHWIDQFLIIVQCFLHLRMLIGAHAFQVYGLFWQIRSLRRTWWNMWNSLSMQGKPGFRLKVNHNRLKILYWKHKCFWFCGNKDFVHTFREANPFAESLAKLGVNRAKIFYAWCIRCSLFFFYNPNLYYPRNKE